MRVYVKLCDHTMIFKYMQKQHVSNDPSWECPESFGGANHYSAWAPGPPLFWTSSS